MYIIGHRTACTRSALDLVSQIPSMDGDVAHEVPCLPVSILAIDGLGEWRISCKKSGHNKLLIFISSQNYFILGYKIIIFPFQMPDSFSCYKLGYLLMLSFKN